MASLVYIFGIHRRCGTNFLRNLLTLHKLIEQSPVHEDYLTAFSPLVLEWIKRAHHAGGNHDWFDEAELQTRIGDACEEFLCRDVRYNAFACGKTPSTENLENFTKMFPQVPVALLVRDPRDVAESARISFGMPIKETGRAWADGATRILDFMRSDLRGNKILVTYENLHKNTKATVAKILDKLDLRPEHYDYSRIQDLELVGSSDIVRDGKELHWKRLPKHDNFNPIGRWSHWSAAEQSDFLSVRGTLGYTVAEMMRELAYP